MRAGARFLQDAGKKRVVVVVVEMGTGVEGKERNAGQNRGQTTPFTVRSPPIRRVAYVEPAFLLLRLFRHLPYTRAKGTGGINHQERNNKPQQLRQVSKNFPPFSLVFNSFVHERVYVCVFVLGGCVRRESCVHNARAAYFVQTFFAFLFSCHLSPFLSPSPLTLCNLTLSG